VSAQPAPPIRLRSIYVDNFKSLVDFRLSLAAFTCLIGLNGSGKSTVLQAIDFISRLFKGNVSQWLEQRQWKPGDLNSKLSGKSNLKLGIDLSSADRNFSWDCSFNRSLLRCTQETLRLNGQALLSVADGHYWFGDVVHAGSTAARTKIAFEYEGSILSQLKDEVLPKPLLPLKRFLQQTASLDLLAPQLLRKRAVQSQGELGMGGERLSAFLSELSDEQRSTLGTQLKTAYPHLEQFVTRSLRAGWKELGIREQFGDKGLYTEARHINDGMLRLMAILAEILTDHQFLLFDEIENGINPELVEFLLDVLVNAHQQILVTTHSPMILNYLDDSVAQAGVQYLYKTPEGFTRAVPFFSIPSLAAKLEVMGPGEAFVDTHLSRLTEEIDAMRATNAERPYADPRQW
jgi:predicted ATPase